MNTSETDRTARYRLGDLLLDLGRREVTRNGRPLRLGNLTFELLRILAEAAPVILTKEELISSVWRGRVVGPETLAQRVKLLREALSDTAAKPRYVEAIRGHGYRLIPAVERLPDETSSPGWTRRHSLAVAALSSLVAVALLLHWPSGTDGDGMLRMPGPVTSVAVLPFENLSPDPHDGYMTEGMHNDLLATLAGIDALRVVSRTSVLEYEGKPVNIRQIGRELGVAAVLEGTLQRAGDSVRINVQLVDAETDAHLWAQYYDREPTPENILVIQSEIAGAITETLRATLGSRAYDFYRTGKDYLRRGDNQTSHALAARQFEQAVATDPNFALAWASLSRAHSAMYFFGVDSSGKRLALAREALDQALELAPHQPETRLAVGYYRYHGFRDFAGALRAFDLAERDMRTHGELYKAKGHIYRRLGDFEKAALYLSRVIEMDPTSPDALADIVGVYKRLRDYERAVGAIDALLQMVPDFSAANVWKREIYLFRDGDPRPLREAALEGIPMELPGRLPAWTACLYDRDYQAALSYLDEWRGDLIDVGYAYRPKDLYYGMTYHLAGMPDLAAPRFQAARERIQGTLDVDSDDPRLLVALGEVLAHQDEKEHARALALEAIERLPDATSHFLRLDAIWVLIAAGDTDSAVEQLGEYLSNPGYWSREGLLPDPRLDPIRNDPRLEALLDDGSDAERYSTPAVMARR